LEDENGLPAIGTLANAPEDTDLLGKKVTVTTEDNRNNAILVG
jgi:hypothetical protein